MSAINAPHIKTGPAPSPLRAAIIARRLLAIVESGYFESRPEKDEHVTARWLRRAIAQMDKLRTVREPAPVLDCLEGLLDELKKYPDFDSKVPSTVTSQLATANH